LVGPDQGVHRGHFAQHAFHQPEKGVFDDEDPALRVVDAIGDVRAAQQVVDGQIHRPDLAAAQPGQHVVDGVVGQDGHAVVLVHPQVGKGVGRPVGSRFQINDCLPTKSGHARVMVKFESLPPRPRIKMGSLQGLGKKADKRIHRRGHLEC